nr:hypothetical protein [Tanacetum cinerariifolium]
SCGCGGSATTYSPTPMKLMIAIRSIKIVNIVEPDSEDVVVLDLEHGLKKKIIKEGDGWEMPLNGDEVEVHHVGSLLNGTRFDSSFDREMPFKFKLGLGRPKLELAILSQPDPRPYLVTFLQKKKKLKMETDLICTSCPQLEFGDLKELLDHNDLVHGGVAPEVEETKAEEVEVVALEAYVEEVEDRIGSDREGWQTPKDPDEVLVKYEARLEDGSLVTKSEEVEFIVKDDAFGENGREPASGNDCVVPPNATIQITLELVSWKIVSEVTTDKKVSKKILNDGEGYDRPNDGAVVQGDNEVPFEFKIDEGGSLFSVELHIFLHLFSFSKKWKNEH